MSKKNENNTKEIRSIFIITLYFIWPSIISIFLNKFNTQSDEITKFILNTLLLIFIVLTYRKEVLNNLKKISFKNIIFLFISLMIIQVLTNLISVLILGVDKHIINSGLLKEYLNNQPLLASFSLILIYPIIETLVFNKSLKDIINNKWAFIICSSLFFWFVNLLAFNFKLESIIATMSCFTTSIIINYFYY